MTDSSQTSGTGMCGKCKRSTHDCRCNQEAPPLPKATYPGSDIGELGFDRQSSSTSPQTDSIASEVYSGKDHAASIEQPHKNLTSKPHLRFQSTYATKKTQATLEFVCHNLPDPIETYNINAICNGINANTELTISSIRGNKARLLFTVIIPSEITCIVGTHPIELSIQSICSKENIFFKYKVLPKSNSKINITDVKNSIIEIYTNENSTTQQYIDTDIISHEIDWQPRKDISSTTKNSIEIQKLEESQIYARIRVADTAVIGRLTRNAVADFLVMGANAAKHYAEGVSKRHIIVEQKENQWHISIHSSSGLPCDSVRINGRALFAQKNESLPLQAHDKITFSVSEPGEINVINTSDHSCILQLVKLDNNKTTTEYFLLVKPDKPMNPIQIKTSETLIANLCNISHNNKTLLITKNLVNQGMIREQRLSDHISESNHWTHHSRMYPEYDEQWCVG